MLRFLLDAHPDLACPPETNLPGLCAQLATVWSLIDGAALSDNRGDEPPEIPDTAIAGTRHTMDRMVGSYLARRGKKRYCDKSLGTARFADLLLRVYPEAKFLCLYRHPMDLIASGIEACPWGLNGYGFEPYIAGTPGNVVLALARFWADHAAGIAAVEEKHSQACHRVRYEDLVSDPEDTADAIFSFLGVPSVPGISTSCFSPDRERFGPADYKIWHTSRISADSVGRGWSVPTGMIPQPVLDQVNELAGKLQYIQVDDNWSAADVVSDVRVRPRGQAADGPAEGERPVTLTATNGQRPQVAKLIDARLSEGLAGLGDRFSGRRDSCLAEPFGLVVTQRPGARQAQEGAARWRVDLASCTATPAEGTDDDTQWDVIGSADTWERVLRGQENFSVALRKYELRYCDTGDSGAPAATRRMDMVADLLNLSSCQSAGEASGQPGRAAAPAIPA